MNFTSLLVPTIYKAFWLPRERGNNRSQCESAKINPARILILANARKKTPAKKGALQYTYCMHQIAPPIITVWSCHSWNPRPRYLTQIWTFLRITITFDFVANFREFLLKIDIFTSIFVEMIGQKFIQNIIINWQFCKDKKHRYTCNTITLDSALLCGKENRGDLMGRSAVAVSGQISERRL